MAYGRTNLVLTNQDPVRDYQAGTPLVLNCERSDG
jgi:hypothetical protein